MIRLQEEPNVGNRQRQKLSGYMLHKRKKGPFNAVFIKWARRNPWLVFPRFISWRCTTAADTNFDIHTYLVMMREDTRKDSSSSS